jgi:hypothetical protein
MLTKPLLLAILAVCGAHSGPDNQPVKPPDIDEGGEDQHFCCNDVDAAKFTGDGCVAIAKENINSCNAVLYCPGKWAKKDGKVTCE